MIISPIDLTLEELSKKNKKKNSPLIFEDKFQRDNLYHFSLSCWYMDCEEMIIIKDLHTFPMDYHQVPIR